MSSSISVARSVNASSSASAPYLKGFGCSAVIPRGIIPDGIDAEADQRLASVIPSGIIPRGIPASRPWLDRHEKDDQQQDRDERAGEPDEVAQSEPQLRTRTFGCQASTGSAHRPAEEAEGDERHDRPEHEAPNDERLPPVPVPCLGETYPRDDHEQRSGQEYPHDRERHVPGEERRLRGVGCTLREDPENLNRDGAADPDDRTGDVQEEPELVPGHVSKIRLWAR